MLKMCQEKAKQHEKETVNGRGPGSYDVARNEIGRSNKYKGPKQKDRDIEPRDTQRAGCSRSSRLSGAQNFSYLGIVAVVDSFNYQQNVASFHYYTGEGLLMFIVCLWISRR